jgi:tetratricopeptide (TPR) repeat protein
MFAGFCYSRNQLWGKPELLIAMDAKDARNNPRPLINLSELLIKHNRCDLALPYLQRADRMLPGNYFVNASWGRALACLGYREEGLRRLQLAARIQPSSQVYLWIGLVYGEMGRSADAGSALQEAVRRDPESAAAHGALGLWYESTGNFPDAEREYRTNLWLDPKDQTARLSLERLNKGSLPSAP